MKKMGKAMKINGNPRKSTKNHENQYKINENQCKSMKIYEKFENIP